MLDSHRNVAEKLERSCSLTEVLFEILSNRVSLCCFASRVSWGVDVIFNSSSNLVMNLWNLFSQLLTYNITAG